MLPPHVEVKCRISNYRRHKKFNPKLVEKVLEQVEEHESEYVVSNVSKEARELFKRSREVGWESRYAIQYLRFKEGDDFLVSEAEFEHDVIDLILPHFMDRFPSKKIVIVSAGKAHVGKHGEIWTEDTKKYSKALAKQNEPEEDWERFYNSQYLEARRNRRLAMKAVPKKLWKKFNISEGVKIDKGIEAVTLQDYI